MSTRLSSCVLLPTLLLGGCIANNPLEISDAEWSQMSTEQRLRAHEAQARLDQQKAERRAAERKHQAELERQQQAEQARLRQIRYQKAEYGDIIQCVLEPAEARHSKGWRRTEPMAFEVMRGDSNGATLYDYKGRKMYDVALSLSRRSNHLELCINDGRQCDGFRASESEFRRGTERSVHLGEKLKGQLRCNLKFLPNGY